MNQSLRTAEVGNPWTVAYCRQWRQFRFSHQFEKSCQPGNSSIPKKSVFETIGSDGPVIPSYPLNHPTGADAAPKVSQGYASPQWNTRSLDSSSGRGCHEFPSLDAWGTILGIIEGTAIHNSHGFGGTTNHPTMAMITVETTSFLWTNP